MGETCFPKSKSYSMKEMYAAKQEGRTIMEFPLTIGVVGVVRAPILTNWRY